MLGTVGAIGVFGGGEAVNVAYAEKALPGVHFEQQPLGGLTQDEVQGVLDSQVHDFLAAPMVFAYDDREWRPTASEIGLHLDTAAMAAQAVAVGRTAPLLLHPVTTLATLPQRPDVALRASIDKAQLTAFLSAVAAEVNHDPVNAALSVASGKVVLGQSAIGRQVDIPATVQRVAAPSALTPGRVEVVVNTSQPALSEAALQAAQATAQQILSGPLVLKSGDQSWTLTPAALGAMLEFKPNKPASGALVAQLEEAKVVAFVKKVAADIDREPLEAQLRWNGSSASVVRQSRDGVRLDQSAAVKAILAQAPTDNRTVVLVTKVTKPAVSSESSTLAGITHLVSTGTSKFAGSSAERVNNIRVAASRLNGAVIPAGGTFSFLTALGPITTENGYMEGLTIQGDSTVPGIGGGVCQVSTTAFRAAFYAGLPIVERHQHTYRVGYYEQDGSPVGFDAAVYDPGVDLRFKNDSDTPILIQTAVDTGSSTLTFNFYGALTGREVKLTPVKANEVKAGPKLPDVLDPTLPKGTRKQLEWSADGVDATIKRVVTSGGKTLISDSFFSRYVPWREKWAVGPS